MTRWEYFTFVIHYQKKLKNWAVEYTNKPPPQEQKAREVLEIIAGQHKRVQEAIAGISTAYHPYDLETGAAQSTEQMADALAQHFSELEAIAAEASLPERCVKKIQKAKRVVVELVATLAFFGLTIRAKVEALSLAPTVEQAVYHNLIPAIYLHLVSEKTSDPPDQIGRVARAARQPPWTLGGFVASRGARDGDGRPGMCPGLLTFQFVCRRAQWPIGAPAP